MLGYETYVSVVFACGDKKYISYSELWFKKKKKRKGIQWRACHPPFMVLERAALSAPGRKLTYKPTEGEGEVGGGAFQQAGK